MDKGTIEDWDLEGHRLTQSVSYGDLSTENRTVIGTAYGPEADQWSNSGWRRPKSDCRRDLLP